MYLKRFLLAAVGRDHLYRPQLSVPYEMIGTAYGAWPVPTILRNACPLVYSFGVGEDVSWDVGCIERYGWTVFAFDPTPRCLTWIGQQQLPPSFRFEPLGLGAVNGFLPFTAPAEAAHVSYHMRQHAEAVQCPVETLETIMRRHGHGRLNLLKMDIEGSEYEVIGALDSLRWKPDFLFVEFHHRLYGFTMADTRRALKALRSYGYRSFYVSATGREFGFMHFT